MKMEILTGQQLYHPSDFAELGSNKIKDWTKSLTPPTALPPSLASNKSIKNFPYTSLQHHQQQQTQQYHRSNDTNTTTSIKKSSTRASNLLLLRRQQQQQQQQQPFDPKTKRSSLPSADGGNVAGQVTADDNNSLIPETAAEDSRSNCSNSSCYYYDDVELTADNINKLSGRLLNELRLAKLRHLACTEVSLPCDLCNRIAIEILHLSQREPCGLRGCTIYIEFEDEPNNSRRIASIKFDPETVSTFEIYLTLRQDYRGWTALLPQFIKGLSRTITLSPDFNVTKNTLYTPLPPVNPTTGYHTSSNV